MNLSLTIEIAITWGIRFRRIGDRMACSGPRPAPALLAALREHGPEIARRSRENQCCWCPTDPKPAWIEDFDSGLGICRACTGSVGETRLAREGFDFAAWERDAWTGDWRDRHKPDIALDELAVSGWSAEHFDDEEVDR